MDFMCPVNWRRVSPINGNSFCSFGPQSGDSSGGFLGSLQNQLRRDLRPCALSVPAGLSPTGLWPFL